MERFKLNSLPDELNYLAKKLKGYKNDQLNVAENVI